MQISGAATLLRVQEKCYCTSCATKTLGYVKRCPIDFQCEKRTIARTHRWSTVVYCLPLTISINILRLCTDLDNKRSNNATQPGSYVIMKRILIHYSCFGHHPSAKRLRIISDGHASNTNYVQISRTIINGN